jgi:uncharacterized protein (DUF2267 family)
MQTSVPSFNHTLETSNAWLKELKTIGNFNSEEEAYTALRAVMHSLRDRLLVNGAAHLAAQIPMLIRGMYYEGWKPAATPHKEHTKAQFLDRVRTNLHNAANRIEPETATHAVFHLLEQKISQGEIEDIKSELPEDILTLWH